MDIFYQLQGGFIQIGQAFVQDPGVWWFLAPIFVLWFAMEIYFGEYKQEKWGFSSSLANAVSFTWVNIASIRFISFEGSAAVDVRVLAAIVFLFYGLFLIYATFRHVLSERAASAIAGPTPIYFASIVSTLWGQGILAITLPIALDLIVLYIAVWLVWKIVKTKYLGIRGEVEAIKKGEKPV